MLLCQTFMFLKGSEMLTLDFLDDLLQFSLLRPPLLVSLLNGPDISGDSADQPLELIEVSATVPTVLGLLCASPIMPIRMTNFLVWTGTIVPYIAASFLRGPFFAGP